MPQYKVRPGNKLVVTDPDRPGQTLDLTGGDTVELEPEVAAQYPTALDLVESAQTAEPGDGQ